MGSRNVNKVFDLYAGRVPPLSLVVLLRMANVALDDDANPWFAEGHAALARVALGRGRHAALEEADYRAVERAITPLKKAGAISTIRAAAKRSDDGNTVKYRLHLGDDAPRNSSGVTGAEESPRPTEFVGRHSDVDPQRPTESGTDARRKVVLTPDEFRGTEEQRGEHRKTHTRVSSEPSGDVDPDLRSLFARLKIHDESVTLAEAISVRAMRDEREKHRSLFQSAPKLTNLLAEVRGAAQEEANVARLAERSFDEFWSIYPRHVAKGGARKAWTTALRKAAAEQLITGARRYAERVKAERTPERYVAHPATWLNQERWTDETSPARTPSSPATYQNPPADAYLGYLDY